MADRTVGHCINANIYSEIHVAAAVVALLSLLLSLLLWLCFFFCCCGCLQFDFGLQLLFGFRLLQLISFAKNQISLSYTTHTRTLNTLTLAHTYTCIHTQTCIRRRF